MKTKEKKTIQLSVKRKAVLSDKHKFMASQRAVIAHGAILDDNDFVKTIDSSLSAGVVSARRAGIPYTIVKGNDILRIESGVGTKIGTIAEVDVRCPKMSFKIK